MKMTKFLIAMGIACLLTVTLVVSDSFALTDEEIRESVQEVISERHPKDTPQWWRGLGPATPRILISMYQGTSHIYHRVRLLQGLGWFDTPEAVEFLKEQALTTQEDALRTTAIRSVAHSQGLKEEEFFRKFLEHPDAQTRFATADALQNLQDPRADEIVAKYLKGEKAPWIAGKLKGELPEPKVRLTPVGSTEDRLSVDFNGEFQGFWIAPGGPREKGMKGEPAHLRLKVDGTNSLKGDVTITRKSQERIYRLERVTGKGVRISGVLIGVPSVRSTGTKAAFPEELPFEAELTQQAGNYLLEFKIRKVAVTLLARRNPAP